MKINSVYRKTIFNHRKAIIFWGIGIVLIGLFYSSIYPSVGANEQLSNAFDNASGAIQAFIVSGEFFSTPDGFIHAEFFSLTMPLIICILAITIGSGILAKEEESTTIELLLARPVSRTKLLIEKFAGMITVILALTFCVWFGLFVGSLLVSKFAITLSLMAIAVANLGLLSLAFGSIALMMTAIHRSRGLAAAISGVFFLFSYIVGTFSEQVSWLKNLEPLSLFHYFDTIDILQHNAHFRNFFVLTAIIFVCVAVSLFAFNHRDTGR